MTWIKQLSQFLHPPSTPVEAPTAKQVAKARQDFGELPAEYLDFCWRYGAGYVDEFLRIYVPTSSNEYMDLRQQTVLHRKMLRLSQQLELEIPFSDVDSVLAIGDTDNGNVLFANARCIVIFDPRSGDTFRYAGGVCQFLLELLQGRFRVPFFPSDFPSTEPRFESRKCT